MDVIRSASQIQANPSLLTAHIYTKSGLSLSFRAVTPADGAILGAYFIGLSEQTRRKYAPHPFDQATADALCSSTNYADTIRMIATMPFGDQETAIAYFILQLYAPPYEVERYTQAGIVLDPAKACLVAPSVADAYQNQGIGGPLMAHLVIIARQLRFNQMLLMGGVYTDNLQAVRFYQKCGFVTVGTFMPTWPNGRLSYDMYYPLSTE